jgi:hypothetical protein
MWKQVLVGEEIAQYLITTDGRAGTIGCRTFDRAMERYGECTVVLKHIPIAGLLYNHGFVATDVLTDYEALDTEAPPIFVIDNHIIEGNHRTQMALRRGSAYILAYVVEDYSGDVRPGLSEPIWTQNR